MERKNFLKACGMACLNAVVMTSALEGCSTHTKVTGSPSGLSMVVPLSAFQQDNNEHKAYVVLKHEQLKFPIYVYRSSETEYTALLMKCTHLGEELRVSAEGLRCPAHNSAFTSRGAVQKGPANTSLQSFPVTIEKNQLYISLLPKKN